MTDTLSDAQKVSAERLAGIRSNIGQYIVREIDAVSLKIDDALWLHTLASDALFLRAAPTPDAHSEVGVVVTDAMLKSWLRIVDDVEVGDNPDVSIQELRSAIEAALTAEPQAVEPLEQQNRREWYEAFTAMRNDINQLIGKMDSQEANLEPGMGAECAAVVKSVADFVARTKPQAVEPVAYRVRMDKPFGGVWQLRHVLHEWEKWDIIEPLYAQPKPSAMPDGWVMVPMEPTEAMLENGHALSSMSGHPLDVYQAMLAAAPTLATKPEGER